MVFNFANKENRGGGAWVKKEGRGIEGGAKAGQAGKRKSPSEPDKAPVASGLA